MDMDMPHRHGNAAWIWTYIIQLGCGHAAWTGACSMDMGMKLDMGMQHGYVHAAWT
jgi:hypothetical protein